MVADVEVAWLHGPSGAPDALLGAKAANLRRLARAGHRVPRGFCVTAAAHRRHLREHGLEERVAALADRLPDEEARRALEELARCGPLAAPVAEAVREAVEQLAPDGAPLAVRSSALGEDSASASFAGLHASRLGVAPAEVEDAVLECWASLWSAGAIAYRARHGLTLRDLAMPVLVQRLVPAEAAAVAFSFDPGGAARDAVVIDLVRGLGAPLVGGDAAPDTVAVDRATLQATRVGRGADGPALPPESASALAEACLDAEVALGHPVDVEAAFAGGSWWIVQGRPITA